MGCKRLQKCCCCASVQTGSVITGALGIILSIATILFIWLYPQRYTMAWDNKDGEETNWLGISNTVMKIILTVNLIMTVLISTLMILGALKRRSWLMLPWVVLGIVLSIGALVSVLHTSIHLYLMEDKRGNVTTTDDYNGKETENNNEHIGPGRYDYDVAATIILIGGIIYILVFVYLWSVVFSHFLNVKDEEDRGRYMKPPYRR